MERKLPDGTGKWTKILIVLVFLLCISLMWHTAYFYRTVHVAGVSGEVWWLEPQAGFQGKNLRPLLVMTLTLLLNALPFLQWKGPDWRLPVYDFRSRRLRALYAPVSFFHWISYLVVIPACIWYLYAPFEAPVSVQGPGLMKYGYHPDDWKDTWIYLSFFAGIVWIVFHELLLLFRTRGSGR